MRQVMIALTTVAVLVIVGCSGGGASGPLLVVYSSVYGVNALSTDENITLHVGDETVETVLRYDQNASIIEKAVGSDNHAYYSVGSTADYGDTVLENSRTYFYAATDCNDSLGVEHRALYHMVDDDAQIKIINTTSTTIPEGNITISLSDGGGGIVVESNATDACTFRTLPIGSMTGYTLAVDFAGTHYSYPITVQSSIDIVIYDIADENATIVPLPRLTTDAL